MSGMNPISANAARLTTDANPEVMTPDRRLEALHARDISPDETVRASELELRRRRTRRAQEELPAQPPLPTPLPSVGNASLPLILATSAWRGEQTGLANQAAIDSSEGGTLSARSPVPAAGVVVQESSAPVVIGDNGELSPPRHAPPILTSRSPGSVAEHSMSSLPSSRASLPIHGSKSLSESAIDNTSLPGAKPAPAPAAAAASPITQGVAPTAATNATNIANTGIATTVAVASTAVVTAGEKSTGGVTTGTDTMDTAGNSYDLQATIIGAAAPRLQPQQASEAGTLAETPHASNRPATGHATLPARAAVDLAPPTLTVPFQWDGGEHAVTAHFHRGWHGPAMLTPSSPEVRQQLLDTPGSPGWSMDRDAGDDHRRRHEQTQDDLE